MNESIKNKTAVESIKEFEALLSAFRKAARVVTSTEIKEFSGIKACELLVRISEIASQLNMYKELLEDECEDYEHQAIVSLLHCRIHLAQKAHMIIAEDLAPEYSKK